MNETKKANLYDWILSRIHSNTTVLADELYGEGYLNQEERKLVSAALGRAMDAWNTFAEENLAGLRTRARWQEAPELAEPLPESMAIKSLGRNRVGGYLVLWGSADRKDLSQEYFEPDTGELTSIFQQLGKLPYFYNHATDPVVKSSLMGVIDTIEEDDLGLWYEAQIDKNNRYREYFMKLVNRQVLGTSSGCLPGAREVIKGGKITRWPIIEGSATPTPMETRQMDMPIEAIKSAFTQLGIAFPGAKGVERTLPEENSERALRLLELLQLEGVLLEGVQL